MFWKYTLFEAKLLVHNRKIWFLSIFLLLIFLVFFMYYQQDKPLTLIEEKRMEQDTMYATLEHAVNLRDDVPEVAEIYDLLTEQSSLVNFQVWYIGQGDDSDQFIDNGLQLNDLRLQVHEKGNPGIPEHLIVPRDEILKENALLQYIKNNDLPIESDSFATNHYITRALQMLTGLLFLIIVLIAGNEILVYERKHISVMNGIPLSFIKRIISKVIVYLVYIYVFLLAGFFIGMIYANRKLELGEFSFPVLIYQDGAYTTASTMEYLLYVFLGLALVIIFLLLVSVLLNMVFRNAFANLMIGLAIFLLPDLMMTAGIEGSLLHPIKYIDIANVLSGELAIQLRNPHIDYNHAMITLSIMTLILTFGIYVVNKLVSQRVPKHSPLKKVF